VTQDRLRINEIFYSVQGESTWAGQPCQFVRLTGCPLRCRWCDTAYAFHEGSWMSFDAILERLRLAACTLVEVTGGEPLSQAATPAFLQRLLDEGYEVLLETSGALPIDVVPAAVHRIVDFKAPDSGEERRNLWRNLQALTSGDEIKFVIASRRDYEWARDVMRTHALHARVAAVLLSPVADSDVGQALAGWMLEDALPARYQVQLHKVIWPQVERGV
jgi:7-carboxy-7-deazaguanine synthase